MVTCLSVVQVVVGSVRESAVWVHHASNFSDCCSTTTQYGGCGRTCEPLHWLDSTHRECTLGQTCCVHQVHQLHQLLTICHGAQHPVCFAFEMSDDSIQTHKRSNACVSSRLACTWDMDGSGPLRQSTPTTGGHDYRSPCRLLSARGKTWIGHPAVVSTECFHYQFRVSPSAPSDTSSCSSRVLSHTLPEWQSHHCIVRPQKML